MLDLEKCSENEYKTILTKFYALKSELEDLSRCNNNISLAKTKFFSMDPIANYCMVYTDDGLAKDCKDKVPPQEMLVKIRLEKICQKVQLCKPKDLSSCIMDTLNEVERLHGIMVQIPAGEKPERQLRSTNSSKGIHKQLDRLSKSDIVWRKGSHETKLSEEK